MPWRHDDQVIAVFSSSLSTDAEFAALRWLLIEMSAAATVGVLILGLTIRMIFARVIIRPLTGVAAALRFEGSPRATKRSRFRPRPRPMRSVPWRGP